MTHCEQSQAVCCVGSDESDNVTSSGLAVTDAPPHTCPAQPCFYVAEENMDKAIKAAGGVSLFFSFTEVRRACVQHLKMYIYIKTFHLVV